MNRKILFAILLIASVLFVSLDAISVGRFFRIRGDFTPSDSWTGGHPGRVLFDLPATESGRTAGVDADGYLSGDFWLGKVGWSTFSHGVYTSPSRRARVLCPDSVFNDLTILCPVDGYAWSQNAGWVTLSSAEIDGSEGVYYNPASGRIEGFGHSRNLGWVPFYANTGTPVASGSISQTGVLFNGVGLNFIGKIAIIGNIAGTRIYSVATQQVGFVFTTINHSDMLNIIRKNIALISRNASDTDLADPNPGKFDFMIIEGADYDTSGGGWTWPSSKRTIIVIGGDVILSEEDIGQNTIAKRAIIALKNESGSGGNVIIRDSVKRIYAMIYAEGTIYSAEKVGSDIIPYVGSGVWNIPGNQLYIKGAIISKNTIGGSLQSPPTCPVVVTNCTLADAQVFDVNYFRTYDPREIEQKSVPYNDSRFDSATTVIEFNPEISNDPPPGIQSIFQ